MRIRLAPLLLTLPFWFAGCAANDSRPSSSPALQFATPTDAAPAAPAVASRGGGAMHRHGRADAAAAEGRGRGGGMGMRHRMGASAEHATHREKIHELLDARERIVRSIEYVDGGVVTTTTSSDPEVAASLVAHVGQMKERMERGLPIRMMDPLFRELFRHRAGIDMTIEPLPDGVRVRSVSTRPAVALLIRAHAVAVDEFVRFGRKRVHRPTPLPEGYDPEQVAPEAL
jgi:hypothetical protein